MSNMSEDIFALTCISNREVVDEIRSKFLTEINNNNDLYHEIDVERVMTEDWQIERFVLTYKSKDEAFEKLIKALQWKKSFGVHDRDHTYFPKELLLIAGYEKFSRDRDGRVVKWGIGKHYKKISEFNTLFQQFFVYTFESLDRASGNKGFVSVNGNEGTGLSNTDMTMVHFVLEIIKYYPLIMNKTINVDMPWILNGLYKIVKNLMPKSFQDSMIIIKREQLTHYLDVHEIPITFGGKRDTCYDLIDKMQSLRDLKHLVVP
ncbi:motile sperm domain-containing protein 2-like [Oppia nitens]|uniref:motile sperm domain-containing protein 2-like n=1 Tax=Oppia nitens TaxID=1686743 RepID=UPI0023DC13CB|nr:motile sperm domain-containing protein 2-like [Oppia nitens]